MFKVRPTFLAVGSVAHMAPPLARRTANKSKTVYFPLARGSVVKLNPGNIEILA